MTVSESSSEPTQVLDLGGLPQPAPPERVPPSRGRAALVLLGVSALLVTTAYGVGRLVGGAAPEPSAGGDGAGAAGAAGPAEVHTGPVQRVVAAGATASCQSADSVDAAGTPVSYHPSRAGDGDVTTAWRCDGDGVGERLRIELREETPIAEVGLVPGYAKTDPVDGTDRYAQNRRITRVRWVLDDGSTFVQRTSGDPADRSLRTMRLPATTTGSVTVEVLGSVPAARDTVAISEVHLARPVG